MVQEQEVLKVAELSKLAFDANEVAGFIDDFKEILDMLDSLEEVDTSNVKPTFHGNHLMNVYREDKAIKNEHYQQLLNNAPMVHDGYIKVPAILDSQEA